MLEKSIKEAYLIGIAIHNSHNLYTSIIKKLLKCTDYKEELRRVWQLNASYIVPLLLSQGNYTTVWNC
jgi:hypothetical protein